MTAPDHTPEQLTSLLHARGHPYMNSGSQSSASSYPEAIANMRKRNIIGSVSTARAGSRYSRMQPASVPARPNPRSAACSSISPPSDEIDPPAKSAFTFLRLTAGRSNGRRLSSVMAALRFSCFSRNPLDN